MGINQFNIRVYGFLIEDKKVLVTDEFRLGIFMTKFPGGGLQFGEGTIDCLKREFMEEMNIPIDQFIAAKLATGEKDGSIGATAL